MRQTSRNTGPHLSPRCGPFCFGAARPYGLRVHFLRRPQDGEQSPLLCPAPKTRAQANPSSNTQLSSSRPSKGSTKPMSLSRGPGLQTRDAPKSALNTR